MKRKHDRGGQETRTVCQTPLGTRRDRARGQGRRGGFENWWKKDVIKKGETTGVDRGTSDDEERERGATG